MAEGMEDRLRPDPDTRLEARERAAEFGTLLAVSSRAQIGKQPLAAIRPTARDEIKKAVPDEP